MSQIQLFDSPHAPNVGVHNSELWTCLSLLQPWASLVVEGKKKLETRSWQRSYRGVLYIHASKSIPVYAKNLCDEWPFNKYVNAGNLITGAILGRVELVKIERSETCLKFLKQQNTEQAKEEIKFGDYGPKRFIWHLKNPEKFQEPIPTIGSLGLWSHEFFELSPEAIKVV